MVLVGLPEELTQGTYQMYQIRGCIRIEKVYNESIILDNVLYLQSISCYSKSF